MSTGANSVVFFSQVTSLLRCHFPSFGTVCIGLELEVRSFTYKRHVHSSSSDWWSHIGVSLDTQALHLVTFFARYAHPGSFTLNAYNTIMKGWLLAASTMTVFVLVFVFR